MGGAIGRTLLLGIARQKKKIGQKCPFAPPFTFRDIIAKHIQIHTFTTHSPHLPHISPYPKPETRNQILSNFTTLARKSLQVLEMADNQPNAIPEISNTRDLQFFPTNRAVKPRFGVQGCKTGPGPGQDRFCTPEPRT